MIDVGDMGLQINMKMQLLLRCVKHDSNVHFNWFRNICLMMMVMITILVIENRKSPKVIDCC